MYWETAGAYSFPNSSSLLEKSDGCRCSYQLNRKKLITVLEGPNGLVEDKDAMMNICST